MGNSGSSSVAAAAGGYEVNPKARLNDGSRDNETTSEAEQHSSHLEGMEAYSEGEAHDKDALTGSPIDLLSIQGIAETKRALGSMAKKLKGAPKAMQEMRSGVAESPKAQVPLDNKQVHGSMIVLGTSGAGKSTVVQQVRNHRTKFLESKSTRTPYVGLIHTLVLGNMKNLVQKAIGLDFRWVDFEQRELAEKCAYEELGKDDLTTVYELWQDHRLREFYTYESSLGYIHEDSVDYFFDKIPSITKEDWLPSVEDVMRYRRHTASPNSCRVSFPDLHRPNEMVHQLTLVDVGGLREQRRSWHHHFDDAAILVFVTSLSDYSCILQESKTSMNALRESMTLFRSLLHSRWFERHSVVLIFTKEDIFRKKIQLDSIGNYFTKAPQGVKGCNYDTALQFIKQRFSSCDPNPNRNIHTGIVDTTAEDAAERIEEVLHAAIIETGLKIRDAVKAREAAKAAQAASMPPTGAKSSRLMSSRRGSAGTAQVG